MSQLHLIKGLAFTGLKQQYITCVKRKNRKWCMHLEIKQKGAKERPILGVKEKWKYKNSSRTVVA